MNRRVVVRYESDLLEMERHIQQSRFIAYDVETTGVNPRRDLVIGIAVSGSPGIGYYLPLLEWNDSDETLADTKIASRERVVSILTTINSKQLLMHNASFDVQMTLSNFGVDLRKGLHCDTMLLKHTCDEEFPFGLKEIASLIKSEIGFDVDRLADEERHHLVQHLKMRGAQVSKNKLELFKGSTDIIGKYAAADADLTQRVFLHYNRQLVEQGLSNFFYKDEVMPLLKEVTIDMERLGVPIDVEKLHQAKREITHDLQQLEQRILAMISPLLPEFERWFLDLKYPVKLSGDFPRALAEYLKADLPRTKSGQLSMASKHVKQSGCQLLIDFLDCKARLDLKTIDAVQRIMHGPTPMFNLSSKHHLKKLFFNKLKEEPLSRTEKGNPQIDDEFLESVKTKYDFVPLLLDYNRLTKLSGAYIDRFLSEVEDEVFYPSYQQHRTISGRYGSDLQQLPRPLTAGSASDVVVKHTNVIRELFVSGPGYSFIDTDYESLEPHIFAHVSGDERLRSIFRDPNIDFYSTIAIKTERISGASANKKDPNYLGVVARDKRQRAKAYCLGIPYGMSGYKLSFELGIEVGEAEQLVEDYLNSFPELRSWMERSRRTVLEYGLIRTESGRVRRYKDVKPIMSKYAGAAFDITDPLSISKKFRKGSEMYQEVREDYKKLRNALNNACNIQIQGLAASVVNRACIAISRFIKQHQIDAYICAQIHDQIIIRCLDSQIDLLKPVVQDIMENVYKLSVPLKAPPAVGKNFRESH